MNKLKELADKYGSDKGSSKHDYTDIYTELFEPIRNEKLNILELGVDKGASIRMWLDYFPNSNIFGLDIESCPGIYNTRYTHLSCEQTKLDLCDYIGLILFDKYHTMCFDIIIDDCSHVTENTLYSYVALRSKVQENGLYIIEDCKAKRAKYTTEILGKYGEVRTAGRDEIIIIRN